MNDSEYVDLRRDSIAYHYLLGYTYEAWAWKWYDTIEEYQEFVDRVAHDMMEDADGEVES